VHQFTGTGIVAAELIALDNSPKQEDADEDPSNHMSLAVQSGDSALKPLKQNEVYTSR
jgi:hypothetical protein